MSLWNKILVWLIGVLALPLLFFAMWTLKTHKYWGDLANRFDQRINGVNGVGGINDEIQKLKEGVYSDGKLVEPGIRQVSFDFYKLLLDRRRVWSDCDPKVIKVGSDDGTAEITLTIDQPAPQRHHREVRALRL